MFVMVGLPAAGKSSRARELASAWSALRLTPDEWMIPLFGYEQPDGKRNNSLLQRQRSSRQRPSTPHRRAANLGRRGWRSGDDHTSADAYRSATSWDDR